MKTSRYWPRICWLPALVLILSALTNPAATYIPGDVVEDFSFVTRRDWVTDLGQLVPAGAPLRLSDFAGKIVFIQFFDPY
jgi:hypothetical protein